MVVARGTTIVVVVVVCSFVCFFHVSDRGWGIPILHTCSRTSIMLVRGGGGLLRSWFLLLYKAILLLQAPAGNMRLYGLLLLLVAAMMIGCGCGCCFVVPFSTTALGIRRSPHAAGWWLVGWGRPTWCATVTVVRLGHDEGQETSRFTSGIDYNCLSNCLSSIYQSGERGRWNRLECKSQVTAMVKDGGGYSKT